MSDPQVLLDRYELGDLIGAGGSARVHRAIDRRLDRPVAVKLLDATVARSADPAAHERFVREARSSARFSHPNAVATYDAGEAEGQLFIVMELVEGGSLADRIAADAPIADRHVVRVGTQLLSALGAAHAAGLVHRDIKPANVLLTRDGTVKLADFGIARRFDEVTSALTVEGMVMGTRAYLAPEASRGDDVGPAADLYAVGATLYEMATASRAPMSAADSDRGADPRSKIADVSPGLAIAISTALAGRPERRFRTADAMAAALRKDPPATATAPASVAPTMPMAAAAVAATPPTAAMPARTQPIPTRSPPQPSPQPATPPRRSGRWVPVVVALLLIGGVVGAIAMVVGRDTESGSVVPTVVETTPLSESTVVTAPPPETTAATTVAPTTVPPTTAATTTAPPTTAPPTTPPDELIPGFPDTDDIDQFIDQLRDRQSTAGKQSRKLGDGLRDVVREDGDDREEEVEDLREEIDEWVDKDELDPVVADRALEFLADLPNPDRDDD